MKRDEDVGAWCLVLGRLVQRSLTLSRETGVKLSCVCPQKRLISKWGSLCRLQVLDAKVVCLRGHMRVTSSRT